MKLFRNIFLLVLLIISSEIIQGQNEEDALRYSNIHFGGSARYQSMAGAFGALGADISVLSVNPAGMARYKGSEFSFTPFLSTQKAEVTFNGTKNIDSKENFSFGNIGIVGVSKASPESPYLWKSIQIGFAYNKLIDFAERSAIKGVTNTSLSYVFAANANGINPNELYETMPFNSGLAYETYLIDPSDSLGSYYTTQMYAGDFDVKHSMHNTGSLGETALSISGNYNNKVYLGASIGFPKIRFDQEKSHREIALEDSLDISSFTYTEYLSTRGNGYNLKAGIIFLPFKWLRIGGAVHTPSIFRYMKDYWSAAIRTNFKNGDSYYIPSIDGSYLYRLKTPGRIIGSLAFVFRKKGLISIDYEYVDYTDSELRKNKLSGDNYEFKSENSSILSNYRRSSNIRIGAEYLLNSQWMLRGGFAYYQNPYKSEISDKNSGKITYALGAGYRVKTFFIDFGYNLTKSTKDYYMYDPVLVENTAITKSVTNLVCSVGFKF